jgi:hypothetical protein
MDPLTVTYEATEEDYVSDMQRALVQSPDLRRQHMLLWRWALAAVPVAGVAYWFLMHLRRRTSPTRDAILSALAMTMFFAYIWALFRPSGFQGAMTARARRMVKLEAFPKPRGPFVVTATAEGLRVAIAESADLIPWDQITGVERTDDAVYIDGLDDIGVRIPLRALGERTEDFVRLIETLRTAAPRQSDAQR